MSVYLSFYDPLCFLFSKFFNLVMSVYCYLVIKWFCFFFFFKQKTAYEIYQCDWSSDVCSSDLIEVKATEQANQRHLKGLKSFAEEYKVKKLILVSNDPYARQMGKITVMPWKVFLDKLWAGEIIK